MYTIKQKRQNAYGKILQVRSPTEFNQLTSCIIEKFNYLLNLLSKQMAVNIYYQIYVGIQKNVQWKSSIRFL